MVLTGKQYSKCPPHLTLTLFLRAAPRCHPHPGHTLTRPQTQGRKFHPSFALLSKKVPLYLYFLLYTLYIVSLYIHYAKVSILINRDQLNVCIHYMHYASQFHLTEAEARILEATGQKGTEAKRKFLIYAIQFKYHSDI